MTDRGAASESELPLQLQRVRKKSKGVENSGHDLFRFRICPLPLSIWDRILG